MGDEMRDELERQVARLLKEVERPMSVEEIVPHLSPVMPTPNDVADVLEEFRRRGEIRREGSYYRRPANVPVEHVFARASPEHREMARTVVALLRDLDSEGEGTPLPALVQAAAKRGVPQEKVVDILTRLKQSGEVYSPKANRYRLLKA